MTWLAALLAIAALLAPSAASAQSGDASAPDPGEVLVLPFANYSGKYAAFESVLPVFYRKISELGLHVMTATELRPLLREYRIRVVGQVGITAMDVLRKDTGSRYALVGSIDIFEPDRAMEVMLSVRLVDLKTHLVITAASIGKSVQETEGIFGLGRAERIELVVDQVVAELMDHMAAPMAGTPRKRKVYHECGLVAVIPLENYSQRRHGAEVLQNLLMAELVARDWQVVEPGIVHEFLLDEQQMARGGVSDAVLRTLRTRIGTCMAVTGEVEEFSIAASGLETATPRLGYGLRLVDARSGRLLATTNQTRHGAEGETVFALGREYSIARLARASMEDVVTWIADEGDR